MDVDLRFRVSACAAEGGSNILAGWLKLGLESGLHFKTEETRVSKE